MLLLDELRPEPPFEFGCVGLYPFVSKGEPSAVGTEGAFFCAFQAHRHSLEKKKAACVDFFSFGKWNRM